MSDQMRVCPECGDLLPMTCSDPAACIMTDDLSDRRTGGRYKDISEHLDLLNKRIEELEAWQKRAKVALRKALRKYETAHRRIGSVAENSTDNLSHNGSDRSPATKRSLTRLKIISNLIRVMATTHICSLSTKKPGARTEGLMSLLVTSRNSSHTNDR